MIDVRGKSVFLSGPMTDRPHNNVAALCEAHMALLEMGAARVFNPAMLCLRQPNSLRMSPTHENYMRRTLHELTKRSHMDVSRPLYDMVVMLPGWCDSVGARDEFDVAAACGIPCHHIDDVIGDAGSREGDAPCES